MYFCNMGVTPSQNAIIDQLPNKSCFIKDYKLYSGSLLASTVACIIFCCFKNCSSFSRRRQLLVFCWQLYIDWYTKLSFHKFLWSCWDPHQDSWLWQRLDVWCGWCVVYELVFPYEGWNQKVRCNEFQTVRT